MVATCAGSGPTAVLVIGDSWASMGALDRSGAAAVGARFCSIGFRGRTSRQIADTIRTLPPTALAAAGAPRTIILLAGVNDVMQHVGADRYAAGMADLRAAARTISDDVRVVEIPWTTPTPRARTPLSWAKRLAHRLWNDQGRTDVTTRYRQAVRTDIDFDAFLPSYAGHEDRYVDGVHLTPAEHDRFGAYLGAAAR
ncbi:hypothetical protein BZG35_14065 [Brevundimonas sp. LM2]|nr:hypothetical protein BZG35_14065 [Brevundimonas sp. LM2]